MGTSTRSIPFFVDDITIIPHTISHDAFVWAQQYLGREVSIREFCGGQSCSLKEEIETGEYIITRADGAFMQGIEC